MRRYREISVGVFEEARASALASKIKRSPRFAQLLINRGVDTPAKYMQWSLSCASSLLSPWDLPDMTKAVDILEEAAASDQLVFICGDYDADGICAAVILMRAFRSLHIQAEYQLPVRYRDGYGLNRNEIDRAAELGASLLITVDCGSANREEVAYARERGLKVIVTDHHKIPQDGPGADAFINPQRSDSLYRERNLCGAAVAWKVAAALYARLKRPLPLDLLDFAGFATITDMMPLTGENRLLCRMGLNYIESWKRPCMRALGDVAGVRSRTFNAKAVSYYMGPRINAVGRVDDPRRGAELMLSDDIFQCQEMARFVEECNLLRRRLQNEVVDTIKKRLDIASARRRGFIFEYGDWHKGVVGIAAGMLAGDYRLPCLIGRLEDGRIEGSGRSVLGTDLHAVLLDCADVMEHFGGHASAAGFAVRLSELEAFLERFAAALQRHRRPIPPLFVDYEMRVDELEAGFINELKELEPTGQGAPSPCFLFRGVRFTDLRPLKEGRYFGGFLCQQNGAKVKMTAFGCADDIKRHGLLDQVCDVVGSLEISSFGGTERPCVNIDYAVAADADQLRLLDREDGDERDVSSYQAADFLPVPVIKQLPIAVAVPEAERRLLLADICRNNPTLPWSAAKAVRPQGGPERHILLDKRGVNLSAYLREVIAILRERKAKCGPDALGVITAFGSGKAVAGELADQVTVLTWKNWLDSPEERHFTDVFLADPPLNIEKLRQSGQLRGVSRLHLVFSENSWQEVGKLMQAWYLSENDMNHAWQRLSQWLRCREGAYTFSRSEKQLSVICDLSRPNLTRLALKAMSELGLITWDSTDESDTIALTSAPALSGGRVNWLEAPAFARLARGADGFRNSRRALERRRVEPELFWKA